MFASLPALVSVTEKYLPTGTASVPSPTPSGGSEVQEGVYYTGTASAGGSDVLYVTPAEIYVSKAGTVVTVNVTVKFRHAQPCMYPDWKISAEASGGVEIIGETKTTLKDPYTAFKQYTLNVTGNGTLRVVYTYGSGCPYGSSESVIVHVYLGIPSYVQEGGNGTSSPSTATQSQEQNVTRITGTLEEISVGGHYVKVSGETVYVRGRWTAGNSSLTWRDVLESLRAGEKVSVTATYEDGNLMATEIEVNGTIYRRG